MYTGWYGDAAEHIRRFIHARKKWISEISSCRYKTLDCLQRRNANAKCALHGVLVAKSSSNRGPKPDTHFGCSASRKAFLPLRIETTQTSSGGPSEPQWRSALPCAAAHLPAGARGKLAPARRALPRRAARLHLGHAILLTSAISLLRTGSSAGASSAEARAPPAGSGRGRVGEEEGEGGGPDPAGRGREEGRCVVARPGHRCSRRPWP